MSHVQGKIEIVALTERHLYLKFHRARNPMDKGRFLICHRNDDAYWLDDLKFLDETQLRMTASGHKLSHDRLTDHT